MTEADSLRYWKTPPDRDEVLDRVYNFLKSISNRNVGQASHFVLVKNMQYFISMLHDSIKQYLEMVLEDEEFETFQDLNLAFEISDPTRMDENITLPEFTGKQFVVNKGEEISILIGLKESVTPIRVHFLLDEADDLYFLKLHRITAK